MAVTVTVEDAVFRTSADFVSIRAGMGMETGAVTGDRGRLRDEPEFQGRDNGNKCKELLQELFIMKREIPLRFSVISDRFRNTGMAVGKLFSLSGFRSRFFILIIRKEIFTAEFFRIRILEPETVNKIKVRAERRKVSGKAADEDGQEVISGKFFNPVSKAGKTAVEHEDKRAQDLRLVDGRPPGIGVIRSKELPDRVEIHRSKFIQRI